MHHNFNPHHNIMQSYSQILNGGGGTPRSHQVRSIFLQWSNIYGHRQVIGGGVLSPDDGALILLIFRYTSPSAICHIILQYYISTQTPYNPATFNQPPMSSLQAAAAGGRRPVASGSAFYPVTPNRNGGRAYNKNNRSAPQCSSLASRTSNSHSPTSVAIGAFAGGRSSRLGGGGRYDSPRTPRGSTNGTNGQMHRVGGGNINGSTRSGVASPAPNRLYKTELCRNMLERGSCPFKENCHYAHSFEEQERNKPTEEDLMKEQKLLLPCLIMMMTGYW